MSGFNRRPSTKRSRSCPSDHRAPLWILVLLSLIYSTVFIGVRLAIKVKFWGLDDVALGLSYVRILGERATLHNPPNHLPRSSVTCSGPCCWPACTMVLERLPRRCRMSTRG